MSTLTHFLILSHASKMKKHHSQASRKQKKGSIRNVSIGILERHCTNLVKPLKSTLELKKLLYSKLQRLNVTNPKILIFKMGDEIQAADMYLYVHYYDHFAQRGGRGHPGLTDPMDRVNEEMRALNAPVLYVDVKSTYTRGLEKLKRRRALRTAFKHIHVQPIYRFAERVSNLRNFMFFWQDMQSRRRPAPNSAFSNELHSLGVLIADLMEMREPVRSQERLEFLHDFLF